MAFKKISDSKWKFSPKISKRRRDKLHNAPPYKTIVREIESDISKVSIKTVKMRKRRGYFRYEVIITTNKDLIDKFHNSSTGYRAQYLSSVENGKLANRYAIERLVPKVLEFLRPRKRNRHPINELRRSLFGYSSKVWIYQGLWLWHASTIDKRFLAKWKNEETDVSRKVKMKILYGSLVPWGENRLQIIGTPIHNKEKTILPKKRNIKKNRDEDIRLYGYS